MSFQTLIHDLLLKSDPDENMDKVCGNYPSPKYPTVSSETRKGGGFEESFKFKECEKKYILSDFSSNLKSGKEIPNDKPNRGEKLKRKNKSSKLSKGVRNPNHSRGRTGSAKHGKWYLNFKNFGYVTYCFVCENMVRTTNLRYHLYFGHVKCGECGKIITSCLKFGNITVSKCDGKSQHSKLTFVFPPVDNLKRLFDEDDESFDEALIKYLKSLKGLGSRAPFKEAITYCKMYLKEKEYSRNNTKFSESDEPSSSTATISNTYTSVIKPSDASTSSTGKIVLEIKKMKNKLPATIIHNANLFNILSTASANSTSETVPKINPETSFGSKEKYSARNNTKFSEPDDPSSSTATISNTYTSVIKPSDASASSTDKIVLEIKKMKNKLPAKIIHNANPFKILSTASANSTSETVPTINPETSFGSKENYSARNNTKFSEPDDPSSSTTTISNTYTTVIKPSDASTSSTDKIVLEIKKTKNKVRVTVINNANLVKILPTAFANSTSETVPKINPETSFGSKEIYSARNNTKFSEPDEPSTSTATISNTYTSDIKPSDTSASSTSKIVLKIKKTKNKLLRTIIRNANPVNILPTASANSTSENIPKVNPETSSESKIKHFADVLPVFPENGFYLIVKKLIEECPNCYEPLDPQDLIFNMGNWLISTTCKGCSLLVFFLLDPLDGSEPKLKIFEA